MKGTAILTAGLLALGLAGCATTGTTNTQTATYNACQDLNTAMPGIIKLKPYMSAATQQQVGNALAAAVQDCQTTPYPSNTMQAVTNALNAGLTEATKLEASKGAKK